MTACRRAGLSLYPSLCIILANHPGGIRPTATWFGLRSLDIRMFQFQNNGSSMECTTPPPYGNTGTAAPASTTHLINTRFALFVSCTQPSTMPPQHRKYKPVNPARLDLHRAGGFGAEMEEAMPQAHIGGCINIGSAGALHGGIAEHTLVRHRSTQFHLNQGLSCLTLPISCTLALVSFNP